MIAAATFMMASPGQHGFCFGSSQGTKNVLPSFVVGIVIKY